MKRTVLSKVGKSKTSKLKKECDGLLTPIIKKLKPKCEACYSATQVAHHWIEKSRSSRLRYELENLVALCHSCHSKIHNRFGNSVVGAIDVAQLIINQRGIEWKERMDKLGREEVKTNVA